MAVTGSFRAGRELWALLRDDVHHNLREKIEKGETKSLRGGDSPFSLINHPLDREERLDPL